MARDLQFVLNDSLQSLAGANSVPQKVAFPIR